MIDRGEEADKKQADGNFEFRAGEPGEDRGGADADKKYRHHARAAPAVAEPARRYGAGGEGGEAGNRKHQQLAPGLIELPLHVQRRGREQQHEEMVVGVADVEKNKSRAVHRLVL